MQNNKVLSKNIKNYIVVGISLLLYILIGYFTERSQFIGFITLYFIAFLAFIFLYLNNKNDSNFRFLTNISILFRLVLLFSIPSLSNDFYRFIWDGRMILLGYNPFLYLPNEIINTEIFSKLGADAMELYNGQGSLSPGNYTCYPPLNQFFFLISVLIFPESIFGSIVVLRILMILADIGTIHFGRKILRKLNLPQSNILLYALNPFIIIELTVNLHFEGITIFFLIIAIYFILKNNLLKSAIWLSLSISIKLIPLIILPVFLRKLGQRGILKYSLIVLLITVILFLPFLSPELITNFISSIDLYFRKFEFNASIYYIIRWIGYQTIGWNIIEKVGTLLGLTVFFIVIMLSIIRKNELPKRMMETMLFAVVIYYFLSTTVHPWYIAVPLILSVFTRYRFMIVWSFTIMLSYFAYGNDSFQENYWLVFIEYTAVIGFLIFEVFKSKSQPIKSQPNRLSST